MKGFIILLAVLVLPNIGYAKEIVTNSIQFHNAPDWLTEKQLDKTSLRIQDYLQWDKFRIPVIYHSDLTEFQQSSNLNFSILGFFNPRDMTIHLGPKVTKSNFDAIFGHEMVHAIFAMKYKGAIPRWLEEGFANFIGHSGKPDYKWIARQKVVDVTELKHPNTDVTGSRYHYEVSTALIEMISSKCQLTDLLQLSVGRKLTTYLSTYCEIKDVNSTFREWLKKKAR